MRASWELDPSYGRTTAMAIQPTRSFFRAVLFVALGFLLAACGSPEVDTAASAQLSYDELRSAVSPCPDGPPPSDIGYSAVFEQIEGLVFFPGECAEEFLGDPLRQNLGEQHSDFLATALELTGTDLELYVSAETELDLVACPDDELESGEFGDPIDHLAATDSWWEVSDVEIDDFDGSFAISYVTVNASPVGTASEAPPQTIELRVLSSARDFFAYGSESSLPFFIGLHESPDPISQDIPGLDGEAAITFVAQVDGSPLMGGDCNMRILGGDLTTARYPGDTTELSEKLIASVGDDLAESIFPMASDPAAN